jgi:hypothetical protein
MSIESHSSAPAASIHVEHLCCVDGCGKWGGFGHTKSRGMEAGWWCWEHYPHKLASNGTRAEDRSNE